MIEKMLEKIEELIDESTLSDKNSVSFLNECGIKFISAKKAKEIVQEVAKEYKAPVRCSTCANYTDTDEIDNGCYLCCKGIEDNYVAMKNSHRNSDLAIDSSHRWIPTADRLPTWDDYAKRFWVTIRCKETGYCTTNKMRWYNLWEYENGKRVSDIFEVIAWKPYEVPAPYQKGE